MKEKSREFRDRRQIEVVYFIVLSLYTNQFEKHLHHNSPIAVLEQCSDPAFDVDISLHGIGFDYV